MDKQKKMYNYLILIILIAYNFLYNFFIIKKIRNEESIITCLFYILIFIASIGMYGVCKPRLNITKKRVTRQVLITVIIAIGVTYCIGAFVGFLKNGYSLKIINIVKNTLVPFFIIIFEELFRFNVVRTNSNKKKIIVMVTVLIIILEIQMNVAIVRIKDFQDIFVLITTILIPVTSKNMLLTYLTHKVGYQPCIAYRIISELYIFFVPYIPRFGDYLNSMFGLILPTVVYVNTSRILDENEYGAENEIKSGKFKWTKVPAYVVIGISIALISRIFPIFAIGIGSESMTGALNKGDVAIACRTKQENIKLNDVIVFQAQDSVLIHRVVEIKEVEGVKHYVTKGDANVTKDNIDTTIDKVYGKVNFRIPYVAYPSVWMTEYLKKHL